MKLEKLKNTKAMGATEMARVLGGQTSFCATTSPGGTYSKTTGTQEPITFKYCNDVKTTNYGEKGEIIGHGQIFNFDDKVSATQLMDAEVKSKKELGQLYLGEC